MPCQPKLSGPRGGMPNAQYDPAVCLASSSSTLNAAACLAGDADVSTNSKSDAAPRFRQGRIEQLSAHSIQIVSASSAILLAFEHQPVLSFPSLSK
jgi:hypothetical protein